MQKDFSNMQSIPFCSTHPQRPQGHDFNTLAFVLSEKMLISAFLAQYMVLQKIFN
jgi:heme/copper-type cytochrome/quinol oxidase subunit 3